MFLCTFDLTLKRVRYIVEKCRSNESDICSPDKRGKHDNHLKVSLDQKQRVIQHIEKFPAYISHYSRTHTQKKYLAPDLSVQQMYRLYMQDCEKSDDPPVSLYYYREVFDTNFNLAFHPPKNDTCGKCDRLDMMIKTSESPEELKGEKDKHLEDAERAYQEKRRDKELSMKNETIVTCMFDLQKCLPTPYLRSGISFYKRQLWVFNLTIYEVRKSSRQASCFMWDETTANRGGQEIASCLLRYIKDLPKTVTTINFYSDCCSGQNRNIYVSVLFLCVFRLLKEHGITEINHKFLVSGHTHLEADSIHAQIEKAKKTTEMDIELPKDWSTLVRLIPRKHGIKVVDMHQHEFLNLKRLLSSHYTHRKKNTNGEVISWLNIRWLQYRKGNSSTVFYKESFEADLPFKELDLKKKFSRNDEKPIELQSLYTEYPLPLAKKKIQDLISLTPYIHPNSQLFYKSLKTIEDQNDPNRSREDFLPDLSDIE